MKSAAPYFLCLAVLVGAIFVAPANALTAPVRAVWPSGFVIEDDGNEIFECPGTNSVCAAAGGQLRDADGNAQNPTAGLYFVTVAVEDVFLCSGGAAACADPDGTRFPAGFSGYVYLAAGTAYAYSTGGAGVIRLHPTTRMAE